MLKSSIWELNGPPAPGLSPWCVVEALHPIPSIPMQRKHSKRTAHFWHEKSYNFFVNTAFPARYALVLLFRLEDRIAHLFEPPQTCTSKVILFMQLRPHRWSSGQAFHFEGVERRKHWHLVELLQVFLALFVSFFCFFVRFIQCFCSCPRRRLFNHHRRIGATIISQSIDVFRFSFFFCARETANPLMNPSSLNSEIVKTHFRDFRNASCKVNSRALKAAQHMPWNFRFMIETSERNRFYYKLKGLAKYWCWQKASWTGWAVRTSIPQIHDDHSQIFVPNRRISNRHPPMPLPTSGSRKRLFQQAPVPDCTCSLKWLMTSTTTTITENAEGGGQPSVDPQAPVSLSVPVQIDWTLDQNIYRTGRDFI